MENNFYSVYCVKKINAYKLILILYENSTIQGKDGQKIKLKDIILGSKRRSASGTLSFFTGMWHGICKRNNITISEIELVLPPLVDYVFLESTLHHSLLEEYNVVLTITSGLEISNKFIEEGLPIENQEGLDRLINTNSGLN